MLLLLLAGIGRRAAGQAQPPAHTVGGSGGEAPRRRLRARVIGTASSRTVARVSLRVTSRVDARASARASVELRERFGIAISAHSEARAFLDAAAHTWPLDEDAILAAALELLDD